MLDSRVTAVDAAVRRLDHGSYNVAGGYRAWLSERAHAASHDITSVDSAKDDSIPTVDGVPFPPNHEGHVG
jgi:hypothetical protein